MMGYGAGLGFGFGGWFALLGCVLLVVGAIVLIAWAVGKVDQPRQTAAPRTGSDALEVLRVRFAQGEITADEFVAAKQVLEAGR
jgi:putative membrane protein